ncbi:30050_t:CDS:1, partial [Gigaspora margarita]
MTASSPKNARGSLCCSTYYDYIIGRQSKDFSRRSSSRTLNL